MNEPHGYLVFFFPQALEALGPPIQPYLLGDGDNRHVLCREVDTAGALIEMTLVGQAPDGKIVQIELMVPGSMVRMIVSAHGDERFGFQPRHVVVATKPGVSIEPGLAGVVLKQETKPPQA
jgi:hypothetical protein